MFGFLVYTQDDYPLNAQMYCLMLENGERAQREERDERYQLRKFGYNECGVTQNDTATEPLPPTTWTKHCLYLN